jgi:hypothetical protein
MYAIVQMQQNRRSPDAQIYASPKLGRCTFAHPRTLGMRAARGDRIGGRRKSGRRSANRTACGSRRGAVWRSGLGSGSRELRSKAETWCVRTAASGADGDGVSGASVRVANVGGEEVEKPQAGVFPGVGEQLRLEHRGCHGGRTIAVGTMIASAWPTQPVCRCPTRSPRPRPTPRIQCPCGLAERFMARALVISHPEAI